MLLRLTAIACFAPFVAACAAHDTGAAADCVALYGAAACAGTGPGGGGGNLNPLAYCKDPKPKFVDSDGDGLSDCAEVTLGTKLDVADTDEDMVSDGDEVKCVSNPLDKNQKCYLGGWRHDDPGNLVATGKTEGSVIGNMQLLDQFGETLSLWDLATTSISPSRKFAKATGDIAKPPEYHILFMTAAW